MLGRRAGGIAVSAMGFVGLKVFAGTIAIGETTVTNAIPAGAGFVRNADLVALTTMLVIRQEVDATSATIRKPKTAIGNALAFTAHFVSGTRAVTRAAMRRVVAGVNATVAAISEGGKCTGIARPRSFGPFHTG